MVGTLLHIREVFFYKKHGIHIPNMNDKWALSGRLRRNVQQHTYELHYRVAIFYTVLDLNLEEFRGPFNETNIELFKYVASLSPSDGFSAFDQF